MVAVATRRWPARRLLLATSSTLPPAIWAAIPARLTGVQRAQPALATRSRCCGWSTTAAAPLSPTAPPTHGAPEPGCQADVVQRPSNGVVRRCHLHRSLRLLVMCDHKQQQCLLAYAAAVPDGRSMGLLGLPALRHVRRRGRLSSAPATARWPAR